MTLRTVSILYRRLPDRITTFEQLLLEETPECSVTFLEATPLPRPVVVGGRVVLDPGAPVVWFTYPGRWYDIGRFHLRDGSFTGWYANLLTPVRMEADRWETTDLCLDVWLGVDGTVETLDEEELAAAAGAGWVDSATARRARDEAASLAMEARAGRWPPPPALEWGLERARAAAAGS